MQQLLWGEGFGQEKLDPDLFDLLNARILRRGCQDNEIDLFPLGIVSDCSAEFEPAPTWHAQIAQDGIGLVRLYQPQGGAAVLGGHNLMSRTLKKGL